jgi:hypothetical protein
MLINNEIVFFFVILLSLKYNNNNIIVIYFIKIVVNLLINDIMYRYIRIILMYNRSSQKRTFEFGAVGGHIGIAKDTLPNDGQKFLKAEGTQLHLSQFTTCSTSIIASTITIYLHELPLNVPNSTHNFKLNNKIFLFIVQEN